MTNIEAMKLACPECESEDEVLVYSEQSFYVNTGEFFCESVKIHDADSKAYCLNCNWFGKRAGLKGV